MADKRITAWDVEDHGVQHEQYFQGAGLALTEYTDIATGIGDTYNEALTDALDNLAQQAPGGWRWEDLNGIEREERVSDEDNERVTVQTTLAEAGYVPDDSMDEDEASALLAKNHYYVTVRVK